jgi:hypothetical protein
MVGRTGWTGASANLRHVANARRRATGDWTAARSLRALAAALACAALAGCAGGVSSVYSGGFWVEPGKYDFIKCPDITQRLVSDSQREARLVSFMERANQDTAGPLINLMVYRTQLEQVRADIDQLQQTAREKRCNNLVPTPKQ